jgi:hypothetical protein
LKRIALISLVAIVALAAAATVRYSGKSPPADGCNPDLWQRVYRPKRLQVVTQCTAIEGQVTGLYRNEDGDLHVEIDPDEPSVLNLANILHGGGRLVVEVICEHESAYADVKAACAGYASRIAIPAVGVRIRATGAYVKDRENGWNEVHPVTKIDLLSRP